MPKDEILRALEIFDTYYARDIRAANRAIAAYPRIAPDVQRVIDELDRFQDYTRYALIKSFTFARGGWHDAPLMDASPEGVQDTVRELASKPDDEVKRQLDTEMSAYFRDDDYSALGNMIDQWDLLANWRAKVVDDGFKAHKRGEYTLSIPTLVPQIEGILREETGEIRSKTKFIDKINKVFRFQYYRGNPPPTPSVKDLNDALEGLLEMNFVGGYEEARRFSLHHALFRVNALFNDVDFADPRLTDSTNRHAVLHGVATDFSEIHSLKLFCSIQLVHEIVDAYRNAIGSERAD